MPSWRARGLWLSSILMAALLAGCAGKGAGPRAPGGDAPVTAEARRDLALVEREFQLERDQAVLERGAEILEQSDRHPLGDAITALMIRAALRDQRLGAARDLALGYPAAWPRGAERDPLLLAVADSLAAASRPDDALRVAAVLAEAQPAGASRGWTLSRAAGWFADLPDERLEAWAVGDGPLAATAGLARLRRLLDQGDVEGAEVVMSRLRHGHADAAATARAERELDAARESLGRRLSGRIGVLCPLTGRYARFGNAFLQGAQLAADHVPPVDRSPWTLLVEDTEADPVMAALRARKLCAEDGCSLLIGALLTATTATAALVAADHDVSLISPTATSERLGLLGAHVLQTNQTGPLEAALLARLASEVLLKQRFAIIRPDTPEGASMAAVFSGVIDELGGEVIGTEVISPVATDFRREVSALRSLRPEVVFAPVSADQMVLLGPQLDFYGVGALLVGPSAWNSSRLFDDAGTVLERAVFAAASVAYPVEWSADFAAAWPRVDYDEEATDVGRSVYLATRLALQSLIDSPGLPWADLAVTMRDALTDGPSDVAGPERYATTVRMVRDGAVVPFPGELYTVAWQREQAALADSLQAMPDSLLITD
jgi:ABC-type branched-subunit amino acid transport system substrate-binding protein